MSTSVGASVGTLISTSMSNGHRKIETSANACERVIEVNAIASQVSSTPYRTWRSTTPHVWLVKTEM